VGAAVVKVFVAVATARSGYSAAYAMAMIVVLRITVTGPAYTVPTVSLGVVTPSVE